MVLKRQVKVPALSGDLQVATCLTQKKPAAS
jgi:hypothetical protein